MAVTNEQVASYLAANPGLSDAQIAQTMAQFNVTPAQMAAVTGIPESQVAARVAAVTSNALPVAPSAAASSTANTWNYNDYVKALKTGGDLGEQVQRLATQDPTLASNTARLFGEIIDQQNKGSSQFWAKGNTASTQAAAADFALRLAENGISSLSQLGQVTIEDPSMEGPPQQVTINKATGQPLPRPELLGRGQRGLDIDYNLVFAADGTVIPFTSDRQSSWMKFREETLKPAAAFALTAVGAPLIGATVAPGLAAATQGAIGGAIAGGGAAALTGGNVLQGALLGGAGGYFQGANAAPKDSIYSLANGTPNLGYMGGGQGLTSTGAANLASMGGAQGLQILAGVPSTTLAEALSTFGGVNPSILADMGLGSGIAYVTPSGIVTQNGTIIGGDVISQLGTNTGFNLSNWLNENVGAGIGDTLANVDTGVNNGLFSGTTGTVPPSTSTTTGTNMTTAGTAAAGVGLTPGQISNLVKAGVTLAGTTGAVRAATGGSNAPMQTPTQGMPEYTPDYYQQLQQYYNSYLPQTPRDVVTPLQQWYNSRSGA